MDFANESFNEGSICRKSDRLYRSHKVAVMEIVAVVVAKHAPIVHGTPPQVDVSKTVGNYLFVFKPDLLFQKRSLSLSFEPVRLTRRPKGRFLLRHSYIVQQLGSNASSLKKSAQP